MVPIAEVLEVQPAQMPFAYMTGGISRFLQQLRQCCDIAGQVGGIGNPIGYFRTCLTNDIGEETLRRAMRRLPRRRTWRSDNPNRGGGP